MPGGRPKGAVTKLTWDFRKDVERYFQEQGVDLHDILCRKAADDDCPDQMDAIKTLMKYAYPALKAVEVSTVEPVKVVVVDATKAAGEAGVDVVELLS